MNLRPYPKYKSSGVESLGDVPAHWEVKRLKYWASINDDSLPETTDFDFKMSYVDIGSVDAVYGIRDITELTFDEAPSRARRIARDGDSIVSTVRTYLGAIAPVLDRSENLIVSTGFAVVRPRQVDSAYLSYAVRERRFVESIVSRSVGVSYPAVNAWEIGTIRVLRPPPLEQRAIADYLDRKAGSVAASLEKYESLLERLREKRGALIARAVTRGLPPKEARAAGLDPAPLLRASGVEWLGDIPGHWEVKRIGSVVRNAERKVEPDERASDPYIGMEQVESRTGRLLDSDTDFTPSGTSNRFLAGDVLYGKLRPYLAKACRVDFDGLCSSELMTLRVKRGMDRRFLLFNLISGSFTELMDACSYGTKMPRTSWEIMKACVIAVPGMGEQRAISDYLDRETAKLDGLIGKVETAIERLREYRSALITAVVTGKVDVRGATGETGRAEAG